MKLAFQGMDGYAYGALQPSAILKFDVTDLRDPSVEAAMARLNTYLEDDLFDEAIFEDEPSAGQSTTATQTVRVVDALNAHCGDQRFTPIKILHAGSQIEYVVPTLSSALVKSNLLSLVQFIKSPHQSLNSANIEKFLERQKKVSRQFLPYGTEARNFIAAAAKHKVPFKIFSSHDLIFSYGNGSVIFNGSITDRENSIGVSLAGNKILTNQFLKSSGFPVPDQARVKNVDEAVRYANSFGYPLVLKPGREELGRGVRANIQDEEELRSCFEEISKDYKALLLEKHIPGDHYRINLIGDELIGVFHKRQASVVGDGTNTVKDLIEILNSSPARLDPDSPMKPIIVDTDSERQLSKQGLSIDCIPAQGQRVLLKSVSHLKYGGEQDDFNELHRENYELCKSVAKTLRLEVAGVDLISQDASRPWYENNAAICEVNAQPQLGESLSEVHWRFLSRFLLGYPSIKLEISLNSDRNASPIFNKTLDEIQIRLGVQDIFQNGCPTQYFSSLEISDDVRESDRAKLTEMLISVHPELGDHRVAEEYTLDEA